MDQEPTGQWRELPAEETPRPTVTPFFAALGITLSFWGLISSLIILILGLAILILAVACWITSIHPTPHDHER